MLKQLLISAVVLIVAAAGYIYFVPGSDALLRDLGVKVSFPTAYPAAPDTGTPVASGTPRRGAAAGGQRGAGGRPGRGPQVTTVITAPVTTATINDRLTAIGQGSAAQSVSVTTQATGTLETVAVAAGDRVKAGQLIGQLDADAEQIAYDKAQLAAKDAADAMQRTQTLAKTSNATTVQLSTAKLALDNANLELRNAKLALDKRSIVTPIAGTVGLFQVTAGNAVSAATVVTTVDDSSSILVDYWVPERYAPLIKPGMPVTAQAIALPGQSFAGTVTAVDSRIDPTSRTLEVKASVPNTGGAIKPGMSFSVAMAFAGENYPAVDPLAVQWGSDGPYVWLLTADSKVVKDKVQIIQRDSDGVLIKGDLKPGQQVVTQGVLVLAEGATVRRLNDDGSDVGATGDGKSQPGATTAVPVGSKPPRSRPAAAS